MQAVRKEAYYRSREAPSLRVVSRKKARAKISPFGRFVLLFVLLAAVIFFHLCQRVQIAQDVSACERLKGLIQAEQIRHEKLVFEAVASKSPERIEKIAIERLGMVKPVEISYITLPEEVKQADEIVLASAASASQRDKSNRETRVLFSWPSSLVRSNAQGF